MARPTVQSIADQLGLSKFAVSRALSGKTGVSEETRRAVAEMAERVGYRVRTASPAPGKQLLAVTRDRATAERELWLNVRLGIEFQVARDGMEVTFVESDDPAGVTLLAETARGIILIGPHARETYLSAHASGLPVVAVVHQIPPFLDIDQVSGNDEESGILIGEFLADLGHEHIVYVHGKTGFPGRNARLRGMRDALDGRSEVQIGEIAFTEDYSAAEMLPTLENLVAGGMRPTAFFCGSDGVAVTVLAELHRLGLSVPRDCTVIGHADYPMASQVKPMLTTVRAPLREMGMQVVRVLSARLGDREAISVGPALRLMLNSTLVVRESAGPPGTPDWTRIIAAVAPTRVGVA